MSIIEVKNLSYTYNPGTPYEKKALNGINLSVQKGDFFGIVGANGSGKTTLVQQFNGLLTPGEGQVLVGGKDTMDEQYARTLWKKVGMVFQYPEQQLFESTVFEDVSYGPRNLGLDKQEIEKRVIEALRLVGLEPDEVAAQPPICLSGGLRRRVAIAGVLAIRPEILVLDEPAAGLDPAGRDMILQLLQRLQQEYGVTVIMISHSIRDIINLTGRMAVLDGGSLVAAGTPKEILSRKDFRELPDILLPDYLQLMYDLAARGQKVNTGVVTLAEAEREIRRLLE
ncbi:MAG: Energy-coupling factor transporter ATP-binding protein EcfA2 [Pelotomaculum sp. PtaB.Bin104]|nr:MAG: Energy-coupling factor transporter ATP-binding protein EcfA2 [Pelotomaculum sp. PtaB.Bin104]